MIYHPFFIGPNRCCTLSCQVSLAIPLERSAYRQQQQEEGIYQI